MRVPWTARRSNQSILKEIGHGISLEGMMLKLKLQYFGRLMRRDDSLKKTDAGRDWGQEEKGTTEEEYIEELYKKDLHDQDNHDDVVTHLESDILECEVKWALESITINKANGGNGIPVELFQILKKMML